MIKNWNYQKDRILLLNNLFVDQGIQMGEISELDWPAGFNEQAA